MDMNFLESNRDFKEKYDELQKAFARYAATIPVSAIFIPTAKRWDLAFAVKLQAD